jgi:hypothetical protein
MFVLEVDPRYDHIEVGMNGVQDGHVVEVFKGLFSGKSVGVKSAVDCFALK